MKIENLKKEKETKNINQENNIITLIKGSAVAIIITVVALLILSIILSYTNINTNIIKPSVIIITAISILIGGIISVRKVKKKGIINGGIVGLIYILSIYMLSSIVTGNFSFNIYSILLIVASILGGITGGIIGANLST